jgi:hypothetical protein
MVLSFFSQPIHEGHGVCMTIESVEPISDCIQVCWQANGRSRVGDWSSYHVTRTELQSASQEFLPDQARKNVLEQKQPAAGRHNEISGTSL